MEFHNEPIGTHGVKVVYGRDPFGNVIELQQIVDEGGTMKPLPTTGTLFAA
jgi:hypothetical protein